VDFQIKLQQLPIEKTTTPHKKENEEKEKAKILFALKQQRMKKTSTININQKVVAS
jgi:hypothetical protein